MTNVLHSFFIDPISPSTDAEIESATSKSAKIRIYAARGMKRGDIAKLLGIKYQFVRNVLITPLKK